MSALPVCQTLGLETHNGVLHITLDRPDSRNAMSLQMVAELRAVMAAVRDDRAVRALVLCGAGGHFCSGGDIRDMVQARAQGAQAYQELNRAFGALLEETQQQPQVVIAVLQGAVLGGGFGLACVSDIAIAAHTAQFGLPETSLGLLPAQIAPFVVRRIGLTQARRLALTAARFDGEEAGRLGLVHFVEHDAQGLAERLGEVLGQVLRCAPQANAATKALLLDEQPLGPLLDQAARRFGEAVTGAEGTEGTQAFMQKRQPNWATESDPLQEPACRR
ncbi:enoyl-CoA hydratase/isomerase family protein [Pseudomonas gingeri]|uniref:enoyl-CoA hydratase/isomerase family protein n=1 Tax=Pseudomonas gingeri TaxID=117681 RepID=UPI0015A3CCD5|nr:enoyl-CoA hydratase-related protein [Pseudomonas gingeri]NWA00102.1 enoyl-CoA hydratase/isomerase family protein [Pseudomonas gingeri]NWA16941.1 enoyl-CoA hydratase/isomerase family protein [Pseudomonas gingeri]NWA53673.1 enoyl-CoA hydratase/isomerase family protein [Pseudomonas gingeri]NWA93905.1 enoyl-CoA hydratase/isomerase family protein [Pseudomonas gingeri]NWB02195.1 enoyl-CoA hydratase/isomerase family protein [Pseudomonas gingeri]